MLQIDWTTILFQMANFLVLLVGLNFLVFRPLRGKLRERRHDLAETLQSARDQETEARRLQSEWEGHMREAEKEAEQILLAARVEAEHRTAEMMEETRQRLDRLTEEMTVSLQRHRDDLVARQYDDMLEAVINLSGDVIQSVTTRRTHDDLVTNFCASIYQLPQPQVQEYRRVMTGRTPTAFVRTPVALTAEQAQTVSDTLSSLIDRRIELQVQTDPVLIAGLQVRVADKLLDNSVRSKLEQVRDKAMSDLVERLGATDKHD